MFPRFFLILVTACALTVAWADMQETQIVIPGWRIETSEFLVSTDKISDYPIWNLIDGNKNTTWVDRGRHHSVPEMSADFSQIFIGFIPDTPQVINEVRIMNGYNKSEDLFRLNSRPTRVAIYEKSPRWKEGRTLVKLVYLADVMGEKRISIPQRRYSSIYVEVLDVKNGSNPDMCVSELGVYYNGENLVKRPKYYVYIAGTECCESSAAIYTASGRKQLSIYSQSEGFNEDGTLLAGASFGRVVVFDNRTGQQLREIPLPDSYFPTFSWVSSRSIEIDANVDESGAVQVRQRHNFLE